MPINASVPKLNAIGARLQGYRAHERYDSCRYSVP
jgi:hypothetical protein